jgi:Tfp pilus assembly major pilin PilA
MDPVFIATGATTVIALVASGVGLRYYEKYKAALAVMEHSAMFLSGVTDVMSYASQTLADDQVTPDEIRVLSVKLAGVQKYLTELQVLLRK